MQCQCFGGRLSSTSRVVFPPLLFSFAFLLMHASFTVTSSFTKKTAIHHHLSSPPHNRPTQTRETPIMRTGFSTAEHKSGTSAGTRSTQHRSTLAAPPPEAAQPHHPQPEETFHRSRPLLSLTRPVPPAPVNVRRHLPMHHGFHLGCPSGRGRGRHQQRIADTTRFLVMVGLQECIRGAPVVRDRVGKPFTVSVGILVAPLIAPAGVLSVNAASLHQGRRLCVVLLVHDGGQPVRGGATHSDGWWKGEAADESVSAEEAQAQRVSMREESALRPEEVVA